MVTGFFLFYFSAFLNSVFRLILLTMGDMGRIGENALVEMALPDEFFSVASSILAQKFGI